MSKKSDTTKHTLHFFRGDFERLQELYPSIGASAIIRTLVRKHIEAIEAKGAEPLPEGLLTEINV